MWTALLVLAALFVAYSNGANDNFKGVATLFGSDTASYRKAITIATVATFAGALSSAYFADTLVQVFSGKGLVPDALTQSSDFLLSVAAGAGATVFLASLLGLPVSTTHALIGALAGAGFLAAGAQLNLARLGSTFLAPMLLSPVLAVLFAVPLYRGLRRSAASLGIRRDSCLCAGVRYLAPVSRLRFTAIPSDRYPLPIAIPAGIEIATGSLEACTSGFGGRLLGLSGQTLVDALHYLSAAAVSFARGLNDTPKIAGLLLVAQALQVRFSVLMIALAMAAGGLLSARKVATTLSKKIARMSDTQALAANLVTAFLVIFASRLGLPVSTTHVSVGAIGGIGLANGSANTRVLKNVLASWVLTLPVAAASGALGYALLKFSH